MLSVGRLASFLIFLGVELTFGYLTSLWFIARAVGGSAATLTGLPMRVRLAIFVAILFLTLILIRSVAFVLGRRERADEHHQAAARLE